MTPEADQGNRAVFLDRDGVVNRAIVRDGKPHPPLRVEEFELLPGVEEACALLRTAGFLLIVATNQPDVGRGLLEKDVVEQMHARMLDTLPLDRVEVCFDPSDDAATEFRKPRPGMLLRAAAELGIDLARSFMIGDRWRDIDCGHAAGCVTIFIDHGYDEELRLPPHLHARSLLEAAQIITSSGVARRSLRGLAQDLEFPLTRESGPIPMDTLFPRHAPFEVDLGSGAGSFLAALAAAFPERNFLGVERLLHRVRKTCRAAARANLRNVRVLRWEIADAVENRLPAESVAVFHLLFPDPWPKRRHHPRRLVNDFFLRAVWDALEKEGEFRMLTDDRDYFEIVKKLAATHPFRDEEWPEWPGYPRTDFEERFVAEGRPFYRLRLRKLTT